MPASAKYNVPKAGRKYIASHFNRSYVLLLISHSPLPDMSHRICETIPSYLSDLPYARNAFSVTLLILQAQLFCAAHFPMLCRLYRMLPLFFLDSKDSDQRTQKQKHRVKKPWHDLEGGNLVSKFMRRRDGYQHLCTVRDDSLEDTGKSIQ